MKEPPVFEHRGRQIEPLVIAARSGPQQAALEILFAHGCDLAWGDADLGIFLYDIDQEAEDERLRALIEAKGALGTIGLLNALYQGFAPTIISIMAAEIERAVDDGRLILNRTTGADEVNKQLLQVIMTGAIEQQQELIKKLSPMLMALLPQFGFLIDGGAALMLRASIEQRRRAMAALGATEERYREIVRSLRELALLQPVARIALRKGGSGPEIALTTAGLFSSEVEATTTRSEILRLTETVACFKGSHESALAVFIAEYLNRTKIGSPTVFANARYGDQSGAELDVVVPSLRVGMEVKVYRSPFTATSEQALSYATRFSKQLPRYVAEGCEEIWFVSNLHPSIARQVVEQACKATGIDARRVRTCAGGVSQLLADLDSLADRFKAPEEQFATALEDRMRPILERATRATGKRSTRRKKSAKKTPRAQSHSNGATKADIQ